MKKLKNKKIASIAFVLSLVLTGGALTAFISAIGEPSSDRLLALPEEHEECVFKLSTGAVPAAEDPARKGYEYFACAECGEMKKIAGNHKSGHHFRELSDGSISCACGASLDTVNKLLGKNEFLQNNEDIYILYLDKGDYLVDLDNDGANDALNVAAREGQFFLLPERIPYLYQLLSGKDDVGNVIDSLNISFDFQYTGEFSPQGVYNGPDFQKYIFMNYQYQGSFLFSLYFEPVDGKIKVYDSGTPDVAVTLSPDVKYSFDLLVEPESQHLFLTVTGDELPTKVLFDVISPYPPLSDVTQIGIGRGTFYCADDSYGLYIDNLEIGCSLFEANETSVDETYHCDHDFIAKGVVDYDHPASERWKKYTCKDCGFWCYGH